MITLALALAPAFAGPLPQDTPAPRRDWIVTADRIYTADGEVIEDGFVRVQNGKIQAVGKGRIAGQFHVAAITPGLVEASSGINLGFASVEQDREITPEISLVEGLDLFSTSWATELRHGVTSTLATPLDMNVIGGQPTAIKTGGGRPTVEDRVLRSDVALRGCFGSQPSSFNSPMFGRPSGMFNRRPTTRMGVEWEIRDAFYSAIRARKDKGFVYPGADILHRVLDGDLPLMIRASAGLDIRTAIMVKEEFAIPRLILDAAAEVLKEPDLLVRSKAAVILPPLTFEGTTGSDRAYMPWNTPAKLAELGVTFALSGNSLSDPDFALAIQPGHAMRGGLSFEKALEAVTIVPARMLGIDERVGSIKVGKDADLVFWSGTPFEYTSRITGVMVSGELAHDPRHGEEL